MIEQKYINEVIRKNADVLESCFACLVKNGLEKTSMRILCDATKLSASSLYYRFQNKDTLIMFAAYYGLENITKEIFDVAATNVHDFEGLFRAVFERVEAKKGDIRFIYQVATSPQYGQTFCEYTRVLSYMYDKATELIAGHLSCTSERLRPYVDLSMATIREYVIWNDKNRVKKQLYYIYDMALQLGK